VTEETLVRLPLAVRGEDLSIGQTERLFEVPPTKVENSFRDYDYDPTHDRFLFTLPPQGMSERREIAVSLGWAERLKARVEGKSGEGR
jgi:hypothetical protein